MNYKILKKIFLGLAQSDKNYGLKKKNNIIEVLEEFEKYNLFNLDTSLAYNNSNVYLRKKKLNDYNLSIKLPKISNRLNLKKKVINSLEDIYKQYNIKKFDTILLHDPLLPLENNWKDVHKILLDYKKKGLIKHIGVSIYTKYELKNILKIFKPDVVQFPYNVFNQSFDNRFLKQLKKKGIKLQARSIFLQGLLLLKYKEIPQFFKIWKDHLKKYHKILKENKFSKLKFNLDFVFRNKFIDDVVIGCASKKELSQIISELKNFKPNKNYVKFFNELDLQDKLINDPRFWPKNKKISKFENYKKWIKNKNIVNEGVGLLSKRPEQFLPVGWPTYYKKAKDCFVWCNDEKKYLDFSLMGVGTNILGYADSQVNKVAIKKIKDSNCSTLISEDEKELADELVSMHPWSSKTIFARTGAEANAVALRVARLNTDNKAVAVCGYHGWHDWYLAANMNDDKLKHIHLEGLNSDGIPNALGKFIFPFMFNDLKGFKKLINRNSNIGVVFMEVERNIKLDIKFLKEIRKICNKKKIVLIFDECSSGFRETYGGIHLKYKVYPDIAVFGKSIANGIPLTAIIGKEYIMNKAKDSFISSTFWSDTLGPSVGLATLKKMKKIKSWKLITNSGKKIKKLWRNLSKKHKIEIIISGIDAMPNFQFKSKKNLYYRNFLTQEFLKNKILASNIVYCSVHHYKYLKLYYKILDQIFYKISKFENEMNISDFLDYPLSNEGFGRLN